MAEWLILQLPRSPDEPCTWLLADAQGQPLGTPRSGVLAAAAGDAADRSVAVLVPSGDALLTEVELPVKGGVRAQQVVAYALEEHLASDIESLHFTLGARNERTARTAVAVVTRALMQQWIEALTAAGLKPEVLCPEAALLPDNPGHTLLLLEGDTLCVRRPGHAPLSLPAGDIGATLEASVGAELSAENLIVYASPRDWQHYSAEVEALRSRCATMKVQLLSAGALPLLAPQLAGGHVLNLLSGDYAPKRTNAGQWQRWRLAAMLAAVLFAVHVAGLALELVQQQHSERALDAAIGDIARSAIPGDSGGAGVRDRVTKRLLAAQGQGNGEGLLGALAILSRALNGVQGASVQALSFRDGGLDLKLRAGDVQTVERVNQALRSSGWQVDLASGNYAGSNYEGRIQMRPPGSAPAPRRSR